MEFRNLEEKDYPAFLKLYNESFPENERRLYKSAEHVANFVKEKGGKFHAFAIDDGGGLFLGFLSYWTFEGICLCGAFCRRTGAPWEKHWP